MAREVIRRKPVDRRAAAPIEQSKADAELVDKIRMFRRYVSLRTEADPKVKKAEGFKTEMKKYAIEHGTPVGDKGHRVVYFPKPVTLGAKTYAGFRAQKSESSLLDEETAEQILKKLGLYEQAVETIQVLVQDEILRLYQEEKISDEEIARMFTTTTKWSFYPEEAAADPCEADEPDAA